MNDGFFSSLNMASTNINLKKIGFAPGLTEIGINAFYNCVELENISFNDFSPPKLGH